MTSSTRRFLQNRCNRSVPAPNSVGRLRRGVTVLVETSLPLRQHLFHAIAAMPDYYYCTSGAETVRGAEHVVEQRPTSDVVQDLGQA